MEEAVAAPLPLGTKRSGTKAAKDAAKCRRFATGFRNDIQPPPVVFQNVRNKSCIQKSRKIRTDGKRGYLFNRFPVFEISSFWKFIFHSIISQRR